MYWLILKQNTLVSR